MELESTNPNGEIVLESKLNHVEPFFSKKLQEMHLEINPTSYFFKKMLLLLEKQDCCNFLIANPNGMSQSFICRQKYNL